MKRPAGIAAGMCAIALFATACSGGESGGKPAAEEAPQKDVVQARPIKVDGAQQKITWTDLKKESHLLEAAPSELARGSAADLKDVRLDGDLKKMVPYYLTVSFVNKGEKTLERPSPERDFALAGADGQAGKRITVFGTSLSGKSGLPEACAKSGPEELKPGGKATACSIVMMPKDREPVVVSYTGTDGEGRQTAPVIWKAGKGEGEPPSGVLPFGKAGQTEVEDADGRTVKVRATPKSVRSGSLSDLSSFKLRGEQKKSVPYYVTFEYRNDGAHKLLPQLNQQIELRAVSGRPAQHLTLIDLSGRAFAPCPKAKPDGFLKPKGSVTECSVFLVPKGDSPIAVAFTPKDGGAETLTWQAPKSAR
ncbi:hypothetical protein GCM10012287_38010 [Streptomyces daqingensis]|uniref:Uncharacterized protein n=1 Tax=Streptomyces daqingensis TaxID=1472640 RepID=A0ABQ2MJ09_9ACTN|nr:hypothetical protein [Streptomyces daqingensis]GGO52820.1 hypothetical protein GCM10012287_38010 [Streptomyces daqingensis]